MPITEAQIEAARAEFRRWWPEVSPSKDMMRACLEAAEAAEHLASCSCPACGNPRRHWGEITMAERRAKMAGEEE